MLEKATYDQAVQIIKDAGKKGFVGITCIRKTDGSKWHWVQDPEAIGSLDGKKARPRPKRSKCVLWVKNLTAKRGDEYRIVIESAGTFAKSGVKGIIPQEVRIEEDSENRVLTVFSPQEIQRARKAEDERIAEALEIYNYVTGLGQDPTELEVKELEPSSEKEIAASGYRRINLAVGEIIKIVAGGKMRFIELI